MSQELTPDEARHLDRRTSKSLIVAGKCLTALFGAAAVRRGAEAAWVDTAWLSALSATALLCTVREYHELSNNHPEIIEPDSEQIS